MKTPSPGVPGSPFTKELITAVMTIAELKARAQKNLEARLVESQKKHPDKDPVIASYLNRPAAPKAGIPARMISKQTPATLPAIPSNDVSGCDAWIMQGAPTKIDPVRAGKAMAYACGKQRGIYAETFWRSRQTNEAAEPKVPTEADFRAHLERFMPQTDSPGWRPGGSGTGHSKRRLQELHTASVKETAALFGIDLSRPLKPKPKPRVPVRLKRKPIRT